jgi:hypothetical protein
MTYSPLGVRQFRPAEWPRTAAPVRMFFTESS